MEKVTDGKSFNAAQKKELLAAAKKRIDELTDGNPQA
jgi:hypothetical protein